MELKNGSAKLLALFENSPVGQAIKAEEAKRVAAERVAVAAQIREIEVQSAKDFVTDRKKTDELVERHRAAKGTMLYTGAELTNHTSARMARVARNDARVAELHARLSKTANPKINEFIRWLDDLFESNHNHILEQSPANSESLLRGGVVRRYFSNAKKVKAWVEAIVAARWVAEAMVLEPDQTAVDQRLETLRKSIPPVESLDAELVEVFPPQIVREPRSEPAGDAA